MTDQRERAIQATMALLPTHENLRRPWASQIVEAVQRALAQPDEVPATIEALRQGMAELGFIIGRNPDGVDDSVAATLLVVRELLATLQSDEGVTDEIVAKANGVYWEAGPNPVIGRHTRKRMRAALESVWPQGVTEEAPTWFVSLPPGVAITLTDDERKAVLDALDLAVDYWVGNDHFLSVLESARCKLSREGEGT